MRISDWSSDVCSSDLGPHTGRDAAADIAARLERRVLTDLRDRDLGQHGEVGEGRAAHVMEDRLPLVAEAAGAVRHHALALGRSEEHTSELQSLMRISYAVFCLKKTKDKLKPAI